jgi:TolB-like protein/Flp pilus assembly protein TadD
METGSARGPVRFGEFEADFRAGELRKQDVRIKLQKQPFQILEMLLERPREVVSREELQQRIWPADTFVDFDQGLSNGIKRLREALCDSAESPRFIETIPRRGYRFIGQLGTTHGRIESLAVLPLENLAQDPEHDYFADGLTEALITSLAKVSALRVTSRTSAMQYKGVRNKSLREIAGELGVEGIVEGAVLRSGNRVRISAQLINAVTDAHVWAESYDRDLRDVLALQSEVAEAVATEVQAKLTQQDREQLARARTVVPEAYEAYLKGRYHWNKRNPIGVKKGAEYFQEAIERDVTYAAAYAGLADCAGLAGFWGFVNPEQGCLKAKAAAHKSLEIEDTAEAHASLGWAILHYEYDYSSAEREFQRAIALNPRYATAHQWYGHCLGYVGRFEESAASTRRALQLDPLSPIIHASHAGSFWVARDWDQTITACKHGLELDPNFAALHWLLAHAHQGIGAYEQAIRDRQRAVELSGNAPVFIGELGGTFAAAGKRKQAQRILDELLEMSEQRYVMAYWIALILTGLNEKDGAFHWLEKALKERSAMLSWAKVDPRIDSLRSDLRFADLLRRMQSLQAVRYV